jgi:NADPH:quinone reductase
MRAAIVTRFGAPNVIEVSEVPAPIPGPGEVSIDVTHAAVGLVDVFIRQGLYKDRDGLPQPLYVPLEVAGIVRELASRAALMWPTTVACHGVWRSANRPPGS